MQRIFFSNFRSAVDCTFYKGFLLSHYRILLATLISCRQQFRQAKPLARNLHRRAAQDVGSAVMVDHAIRDSGHKYRRRALLRNSDAVFSASAQITFEHLSIFTTDCRPDDCRLVRHNDVPVREQVRPNSHHLFVVGLVRQMRCVLPHAREGKMPLVKQGSPLVDQGGRVEIVGIASDESYSRCRLPFVVRNNPGSRSRPGKRDRGRLSSVHEPREESP